MYRHRLAGDAETPRVEDDGKGIYVMSGIPSWFGPAAVKLR
jgi:hypothetical protein